MKIVTQNRISLLQAVFLALCLSVTEQRKSFLVKEQHSPLLAPKVTTYDTTITLFNSNNYKMTIDNQIQLVAGWNFLQTQGYYKGTYPFRQSSIRYNAYITEDFVLHPFLQLSNLFTTEMFLQTPKFTLNMFLEFIWFPVQNQMCMNVGWNSNPIQVTLSADFNVIQCYKNVINSLVNWSQWNI